MVLAVAAMSITGTTLSQTPLQNEDAKLLPTDGATGDTFGSAVAIDANVAIIGAQNDDDSGPSSGSAYIYRFDGTDWNQEAKLTVIDGNTSDAFGGSVSVAGNLAVVGAPGDDDGGFSSGSIYVYRFDGSSWSLDAKLGASDAGSGDGFGMSISCDEDTVLVGAPGDDGSSGSLYVFRYDGASWSQQAKLTASDAGVGDMLGISVSIFGSAAIGGARLDDDGGLNAGAAYVFRFDGTSWSQEAKLLASDAAGADLFGAAVSIDRTVAVIGAPLDDDGAFNAGSAYVFRFDGTSWNQETKLVAADIAGGDQFGIAVSNCLDIAVVGSQADDVNGFNSGAAYVYQYDGTSWDEVAKLVASDGASDDRLGGAVSTCENAVISAIGDDDNGSFSGAAYVFVLIDNVPPMAAFDYEQLSDIGTALVRFDATDSSDPDDAFGDLTFEWTIDGDVVCTGGTECVILELTLPFGAHEVTLRVTDPDGAFDEVSMTINLDPAALSLVTIEKAKVMFEEDRITASGEVALPFGVDFGEVLPLVLVGVNVAGTGVLPDPTVPLIFGTHGRNDDKWSFDDAGAALGIRRFVIDWADGDPNTGRYRLEAVFGAAAFPLGTDTTPRTLEIVVFIGAAGYPGEATAAAPELKVKGNHWQRTTKGR